MPHPINHQPVSIGSGPTSVIHVGAGNPLLFILGPCVIESREHALDMAHRLSEIRHTASIPVVFKASYDKANRTSHRSFRGIGKTQGLAILEEIRNRYALPVLSDIHESAEVPEAASVLDILQIPAFLSRQTDLLRAAGQSGKPVHLKKGQFLAPEDMGPAAAKISETGNSRILLCERGTTFGYHNLVVDFRSLAIMSRFGYPVIFDGTHSVQSPGGGGDRSGGDRTFVPLLVRAAVAAGCNGLFLETHQDPDQAPSDGPNMIPLALLPELISEALSIHSLKAAFPADPAYAQFDKDAP
ncbi:MAG: 3-deoxy-8-phosphooctulonate synthase [Nitrospirota bacterium]|nr:3-deoxy-8-phosphooctulonate synthase [Nitrospirota bacterium]